MQSAVASFQKVAGLGNACPYISSAIKTIGKHFGCLKSTIHDQLEFSSKTCVGEKEILRVSTFEQNLHTQKSVQSFHSIQPSVLRPQKGLPDDAVAVLKAWLFEHFLHPLVMLHILMKHDLLRIFVEVTFWFSYLALNNYFFLTHWCYVTLCSSQLSYWFRKTCIGTTNRSIKKSGELPLFIFLLFVCQIPSFFLMWMVT